MTIWTMLYLGLIALLGLLVLGLILKLASDQNVSQLDHKYGDDEDITEDRL